MKSSIGDRMKKNYEKAYDIRLPMRMPVILRLDGKAFHTLTRGMVKPFDDNFILKMSMTARYLCQKIQGAVMAYVQSDEISILLHTYKKLESGAWFDNKVQKIVSVSAGLASAKFTQSLINLDDIDKTAVFDARVFVVPESEVCNYFIWRQQDWERNSIQMLARSLYSHKECHKKNRVELNEMCFQKGKNWNNLHNHLKRGTVIVKNEEGKWEKIHTPQFTKDRDFINDLMKVEEDE